MNAHVRKGNGWWGGEATLKKRLIGRINRIVLDHTQRTKKTAALVEVTNAAACFGQRTRCPYLMGNSEF